jgi:hypothetical protein
VGKIAVEPRDFVTLARRLGKNQDEASLRAAASLAYYGAFHFAGEKLERLTGSSLNSFAWTGVTKNHRRLRDLWAIHVPNIGYAVAELLFYAHELRKKADYDLRLVFTTADKDEAFRFVSQTLLAVRQVR